MQKEWITKILKDVGATPKPKPVTSASDRLWVVRILEGEKDANKSGMG